MIITNPLLPVAFPIPFINEHDAPIRVTISSNKVIQTTRAIGGYNFSHWGDQPDLIEAEGSVLLLPGYENLGLISLSILKQLYRLDKKRIKSILGALSKYLPGLVIAVAVGQETTREVINNTKALNTYQHLKSSKLNIRGLVKIGATTASTLTGAIIKGMSINEMMKRILRMKLKDLSVTYIYHDMYIYSGFFTRFSYTRDANDPRKANYDFSFTVDWSTESLFADKLLDLSGSRKVIGVALPK